MPIVTQQPNELLNHNWHKYTIRLKDKETRKKVKDKLGLSIHYEKPLSNNTMYLNIPHKKDKCVNSKLVSDTIVSLPIHAWLTDEEVESIITTVRNSV